MATKKITTKTKARKPATATTARTKAKPAAVKKATVAATSRRLPLNKKQSKQAKKAGMQSRRLPSIWKLCKITARLLWEHRELFIGLTIVYGILNIILVRGIAGGTDVSSLKQEVDQAVRGNFGQIGAGFTVFAELVGSSGNGSSDTAGAYQVFVVLLSSLAIIWALRQAQAGIKIRIRDAYYRGIYPLVPFILVLCVIGLQLLPLIIGTSLYNLVISNGIAVNGVERLGWGILALGLAFISLYLVASSLFALYIVTLPDMTPMKALRSARELVRYRRWTILRKVLILPVLLFLVAAIIMLPIILFITPAAQWVFFILTMFALVVVHSYLYNLYRELLHD